MPSEVFRLDIPSALFRTLVKWWLGLPVLRTGQKCPECGDDSDELGYHCLTCRYAGRIGVRHNAVAAVIFFAARAAHMDPLWDAQILPGGEELAHRRSDIRIKYLGIVKDLDVAVTHPLRPDFLKRQRTGQGPRRSRTQKRRRWTSTQICVSGRARLLWHVSWTVTETGARRGEKC